MNHTVLNDDITLNDPRSLRPTSNERTRSVRGERERFTTLRSVVPNREIRGIDDGAVDDVIVQDSEDLCGIERRDEGHGGCDCGSDWSEDCQSWS